MYTTLNTHRGLYLQTSLMCVVICVVLVFCTIVTCFITTSHSTSFFGSKKYRCIYVCMCILDCLRRYLHYDTYGKLCFFSVLLYCYCYSLNGKPSGSPSAKTKNLAWYSCNFSCFDIKKWWNKLLKVVDTTLKMLGIIVTWL